MQQEGPLAQPVAYPRHSQRHYHNGRDNSGSVALSDLTGTISTAQIADGAVTSAKILDATIVAADLADGAVTSAKILDGTIATVDIAANAVTQNGLVRGATNNPTTTSTTYVDLTDMAVTLTTTGGDLLCWFAGTFRNSGAGNLTTVGLALDGAAEVAEQLVTCPVVDYFTVVLGVHRFTGVTATSHTVRARWKVSAGTSTAGATFRSLLVVETKR